MAVAEVELTIEGRESEAVRSRRPRDRYRSLVIFGRPTETNCGLAAAFAQLGQRAQLAESAAPPDLQQGDLAIARLDVLPTLDGIEPGLWGLPRLEHQGVQLLNRPLALYAAHDKLSTALLLGRAGVAQPRTAHVCEVSVPSFPPPYVVKPRFGSWGRDVYLCRDESELQARLDWLGRRGWFRRQGALVQSLVEPTGRDLRLLVAGGKVVGAVERRALPGEWRTNVALGAVRRRVNAPHAARALARRAVAALGLDLAGVDIARDESGRSYILEVNGAVDFNAAYADDVFATAAAAMLDRAARDHAQRRLNTARRRGRSAASAASSRVHSPLEANGAGLAHLARELPAAKS